jgi:hypothetical protein
LVFEAEKDARMHCNNAYERPFRLYLL